MLFRSGFLFPLRIGVLFRSDDQICCRRMSVRRDSLTYEALAKEGEPRPPGYQIQLEGGPPCPPQRQNGTLNVALTTPWRPNCIGGGQTPSTITTQIWHEPINPTLSTRRVSVGSRFDVG